MLSSDSMNILLKHLALEIVVLSLSFLAGFCVWIARFAGDEIAGIRSIFGTLVPRLRETLTAVGAALWAAWCWGYILRWKIKSWSLHKAFNSVLGVLMIASIYFVIETSIAIMRFLADADRVDSKGRPLPPNFWVLPHIHLPLWVELILLLLALFMVWHYWTDWRQRSQNREMPRVARNLLVRLDQARTPGKNTCSRSARTVFLEELMARMKERISADDKREVWLSLMEETQNGNLAVTFVHPNDHEKKGNLGLRLNEGGAGVAFSTKSVIYIPSTKHRMGINVDTLKPIGLIFKPDPASSALRCLLCVPVIIQGKVVAILNVACNRPSAFNPFQLDLGQFTAAMVMTIG